MSSLKNKLPPSLPDPLHLPLTFPSHSVDTPPALSTLIESEGDSLLGFPRVRLISPEFHFILKPDLFVALSLISVAQSSGGDQRHAKECRGRDKMGGRRRHSFCENGRGPYETVRGD